MYVCAHVHTYALGVLTYSTLRWLRPQSKPSNTPLQGVDRCYLFRSPLGMLLKEVSPT
uniref:Uncharacterized protein n=1 Tax=Anguilla anguilla TaxID=7936 RepID=A0A0E9VJA7_ANGAN